MLARRAWLWYLGAALIAELLLPVAPLVTAVLDTAAIVGALTQFGLAQRSPLAIGDPASRLLPAVALLPLLRMLSLTMPVPELPRLAWLVLAGAPILVAVAATARLTTIDVREMGLARVSRDLISLGVVGLSVPVGIVLSVLAPPVIDLPLDSPPGMAVAAAVVVSCAAIPEELVFRAVMQPLMAIAIGPVSVVVVALAFGLTYVGTGSILAVGLMTAVGLAYGLELSRSGSIWAPIIGHSLLTVTAVMAPALLAG